MVQTNRSPSVHRTASLRATLLAAARQAATPLLALLLGGALVAGAPGCGGSPKKEAETPVTAGEEPDEGTDEGAPEESADDGMAIEGTLGEIDASHVRKAFQSRWAEVEACFTAGTGEHRFLGGRIELRFRVSPDGSVKSVHVARGNLGAWPIEKCVLGLAKGLALPKPKGGEAQVEFPLDFPARASVADGDPARGEAELGDKLPSLAACKKKGTVPSGAVVTVYVGPGGEVKSAGFALEGDAPASDVSIDERWADCAYEKALGWKLTDPRGTVTRYQATLP